MELNAVTRLYFHLGLNYEEILCSLAINHGIIISLRTLKRRLSEMGLFRRKYVSDILEVTLFILEHIGKSGCQSGYRWMHNLCILNGFRVSRSVVSTVMSILDPEGCDLRRRRRLRRRQYYAKGPNYLWHVDSYDKLKQYGLCVNGCIDGFSRKIIWCKVTCSSSNPRIIAGHYVNALEKLGACPKRVRGDRGTENKFVAEIQQCLSDRNSFFYGPSTANQRIEALWCQMRMECFQFWIEFLGLLKDVGLYNGDPIDKNLVQFVFISILQVRHIL